MNQPVRFVFVLYYPTEDERRRAWDIVVDNTQHNRGYGGGANVGIRQALDKGAEWIVVCNQDVRLTKEAITHVCVIAKKRDPGIFGPEAGSLDPVRWTTNLPAKGTADYISASCMAIHRKVFETIGYFFEPYFLYYEDVDFCVRAQRARFGLTKISLPGFTHAGGAAKQKTHFLARNHLLFVCRQAPWRVKFHELMRLPKTIYDYWR